MLEEDLINNLNTKEKYSVGDVIQDIKRDLTIIQLAKKKHKNNKKEKACIYHCNKCGHNDIITESNLNHGNGCVVCAGQKIVKEINSLWSTHLELVEKYFVDITDSFTVSSGTSRKVRLRCPNCSNVHEMAVRKFIYNGYSCNKCGDGISYPNKFMRKMLELLNMCYIAEYNPEWIKPRRYDFCFELDNKKHIVEMDGGLHNNPDAIDNDDQKDYIANLYQIKVIRINCDYGKSDRFEYIKQNILDSELSQLLDLSKVDFLLCHEFALSSMVKEVCVLFNIGFSSAKQIAKEINLDSSTVVSYLRQGNKLGWCNYVTDKENSDLIKKQIIELCKTDICTATELKNIFNLPKSTFNRYIVDIYAEDLINYDVRYENYVYCVNNGLLFKDISTCAKLSNEFFGVSVSSSLIWRSIKNNKTSSKGLQFSNITKEMYSEFLQIGKDVIK